MNDATPARATARPPFAVVGIGASAGGIEALQGFFSAVPADLGLAFAVVVHLSPEHRSHLASIIGARTTMPVEQVTSTVPLKVANGPSRTLTASPIS